jgi:hypothetical protein
MRVVKAMPIKPWLLMATLAGVFLAFSPPARAESPWWHLTSGTRPAYLHAGAAKPAGPGVDEVQKVTVEATGGKFVLANMTKEEVEHERFACFDEETEEEIPKYHEFDFNASASEVQQGLEQICGYGSGSVEVSGGPGDPLGANPYVITFRGALGSQAVRLINTEIPGEPTALEGNVVATEVTAGHAGTPATSDGEIYVTAENVGDRLVDGAKAPVQLVDIVPPGLKVTGVAATKPFREGNFQAREPLPCSTESKNGVTTAKCTLNAALAPYDQVEMRIGVDVEPSAATGELNQLSIFGGEAPAVSIKRPVTISSEPVPFGVESYEMGVEEEGGSQATQAGAHPFQLTTTIALNQLADINPLVTPPEYRPEVTPPALSKDLKFKLPAGLIGDPTSIPQCTTAQFFETVEGKENKCPAASAVGVATATVHEPATVGTSTITEPIFNLEPREGEPARFGFYVVLANSPVFIDTSVRTGGDYGVTVSVNNITQTAALLSSEVTFWGVPGDPRHNGQRGWGCLYEARGATVNQPCTPSEEQHPKPFLSLPTSCSSQLQTSVEGDPWSAPGSFFAFTGVFEPLQALVGCSRLPFGPQIKVAPDFQEAARPSGMAVDVHVPQEANENAAGVASSNIRSIAVAFPAGVTLNPSAAGGLEACSEGGVGFLGATGPREELLFTPTLPEAFCPDAAKVGSVKIKTPLLPPSQALEGAVYLATPAPNGEVGQNPFNALLAMYIIARDPVSGVLVKLPGSASLDQSTGQITATFQNTPDLSFEDAEVHLFGGERAPLATPSSCGSYTTTATFIPWSGSAPVVSKSTFSIVSGPNGAPCPATQPFTPSLAAGTSNAHAGAFSPLTTTISREDGNQDLRSISLHTPPGISGVLTGVALCPEAQADLGRCPNASLIGHTTVSVGLGADPFTVTGGQVFLTESYRGAPFGLSIVTPAVAGPFDLGDVVVRARVEVDPHTAALTVSTDEAGPYAIPGILDGIPLPIKHVNVTIDRPGFTFNPTNCTATAIAGTITSAAGASVAASSPFQATSCQSLKFSPKFTVTTSGKTSKANGASLSVKLSYPAAPIGTYANLAKVKVSLPKQLPSRLTTLQKACISATFEADPTKCPKESIVGQAKVVTPLLPVPLTGPAYFVSHAAEAFPDLTIVLKGYGITVDLVGSTRIKNGVTMNTFKATPDVPFSSFELNLPQGKFSALTANTNLCKSKLVMPTEFTAQNGAELIQSTAISVSGCAKPVTARQRLAKAMKACHKKKRRSRRLDCERQAQRRFGGKSGKRQGRKKS